MPRAAHDASDVHSSPTLDTEGRPSPDVAPACRRTLLRMAHFETQLSGDVDDLVAYLDRAIPGGSVTASLEEHSDHRIGDARMVVRVYERYSAFGGNRVSLGISILAVAGQLAVTAITAGGSQAVFFKINTVGEQNFLSKAVQALQSFSAPA